MSSVKQALARQSAPLQVETGPNGLARERVADIQRSRMLSSTIEIVAEHGSSNVTVAHVVTRSGVSRRTFYELFADCEECLLAALEEALARARAQVLPAYEAGNGWLERMRLGLSALLSFLDAEPSVGRVLVVESLGAGPQALQRRATALADIALAVDVGRNVGKTLASAPPVTAEGLVGAIFAVIHGRMIVSVPRPFIDLRNELMSMIATPYLGPAVARRELRRPIFENHPNDLHPVGNPLRELGMRLTYRTVRVLLSVADNPASSNREIAVASDITDQGQISKLLARLQRRGLVQNTGLAPGQGAPNAWTLTAKGMEVARAMRTETSGRNGQ